MTDLLLMNAGGRVYWKKDSRTSAFSWTAPSGRVYRVYPFAGVINATCDGAPLRADYAPRGVTPRVRWWRTPERAMLACEESEGGETAQPVQTSAPAPPAVCSPLEEAEEQFGFRVQQALASKRVGSIDGARRWLLDAVAALDVMQKAQRDAAVTAAEAKR